MLKAVLQLVDLLLQLTDLLRHWPILLTSLLESVVLEGE